MIESPTVLKKKIFIDGQAGTTGLRIRQWIQDRRDIELLTLADGDRRSVTARQQAISLADLAILCLPDEAAPGKQPSGHKMSALGFWMPVPATVLQMTGRMGFLNFVKTNAPGLGRRIV